MAVSPDESQKMVFYVFARGYYRGVGRDFYHEARPVGQAFWRYYHYLRHHFVFVGLDQDDGFFDHAIFTEA